MHTVPRDKHVNHRFCFHLGCLGSPFLAIKVPFRVALEEVRNKHCDVL